MACPGYQQSLQSSLAGAYERVGIAGTVKVEFRVRDGAVVEVNPVAGPSEYYRTVRSAVRRFHCQARGSGDALVSLDIVFRGSKEGAVAVSLGRASLQPWLRHWTKAYRKRLRYALLFSGPCVLLRGAVCGGSLL